MRPVKIETLKRGELFQRTNNENAPLYTRGEYNALDRKRGDGRYMCDRWNTDGATWYAKRGTIVYVD